MEKGIRYAYFMGLARALRHIPLILVKLLLNLACAFALTTPLRAILHKELDYSAHGRDLINNMDPAFYYEFRWVNEQTFTTLWMYWLPFIAIFLLTNLYLSGGILETIQRSDRAVWREIFRACRSHFLPLVWTLILTMALAIPVVLLPLIGLDKGLKMVEEMADPKLLVWGFWIMVLIGVLLLIYAITQVAARFESNRIGRATFVIALLGLSSFGMYEVSGFIKDIDRNHPDELLSFTVYWFGVLLILGLGGTWVVRVYHYTRLLVCRPYRDPQIGRIGDTLGQFFNAIGFTLRFYARTFWIWALFTLTQIGLVYLRGLLHTTLDIGGYKNSVGFWYGQLFIGLHITLSIAMAGAFILFHWSQDGLPGTPEKAGGSEGRQGPDEPQHIDPVRARSASVFSAERPQDPEELEKEQGLPWETPRKEQDQSGENH